MADELEILTENAAGDGWVDSTPSAVSTGYQAQNTNIAARSLGDDKTYVRQSDDGLGVTIEISGPVDDGGNPFKLTAQTTLYPSSAGTWYISVTAGTTSLLRSLELVQGTPAYDPVEGVLMIGTDRILNWIIDSSQTENVKATPIPKTGELGAIIAPSAKDAFIRYDDAKYLFWATSIFDSFATAGGVTYGLAFDGTNLIEINTAIIYIHDGITSSILSSFSPPGSLATSGTHDGTNLITCDSGTQLIYIHDGLSATILSSFASPSANPYGLAYDGTNLISIDNGTDLIYIHDGISSTVLSSFAAPANNPYGLTYDGANLISSDRDEQTIYVHKGISVDVLSFFSAPVGNTTGLTYDGINLISADSLNDEIYRYGLEM